MFKRRARKEGGAHGIGRAGVMAGERLDRRARDPSDRPFAPPAVTQFNSAALGRPGWVAGEREERLTLRPGAEARECHPQDLGGSLLLLWRQRAQRLRQRPWCARPSRIAHYEIGRLAPQGISNGLEHVLRVGLLTVLEARDRRLRRTDPISELLLR